MVQKWNHRRHIIIFVLFATWETTSQTEKSFNQNTYLAESSATDQPEPANVTEAEVRKVKWDPADPADGTDGHARDHHHDYDHYEKAHGHDRDHLEQNENDYFPDHHHHPDEDNHDALHHTTWGITQPHYDLRDRPHGTSVKEPTHIQIHAYADFVEYINEREGEMTIKLFLVAFWTDRRMRPLEEALHGLTGFDQGMLPLPGHIKNDIWVPDISVPMARRVNVPAIQQPAESITLMANGYLKYSAFFVISFKCRMHYQNYPMDVQECNLDFMSYKYSSDELRIRWHSAGLGGNKKIDTKHFHGRIFRPKGNSAFVQHHSNGSTRDVLRISYFMKRHLTFHLLQTYLPSIMLVFIGWLSLLVPLDFAYGRMVLSVTTLLVLVSIFVTTSQFTPGTNEVKALDIWLFMCIFFVFSAIVSCIADLRLLSMVEKESQIAGEEGADADMPPIVDERLRASQGSVHHSTVRLGDTSSSYNVKFYGGNTPFQTDKEVLIATPAVLKWLRIAVLLERIMTVAYPALFVLCTAVYWAVYISARNSHHLPENED